MALWRLRFGGRPTPNQEEWVTEILRHIRDGELDAIEMLQWLLNRQSPEGLVEIAKALRCEKCNEPLGNAIKPYRDRIPRCHKDCSCPGCGGPALDDPEQETCPGCLNIEGQGDWDPDQEP